MVVSDLIRRLPVTAQVDETVAQAAGAMERAGLGSLVVVDGKRPVGIVTDRDLVRRVLARGLPVDSRIDAVMSIPLVTIQADSDIHDLYGIFRRHAIRRLPVMREGDLVGVVSVDDLLVHLSADFADLMMPVTGELLFPQRDSSVPARPTA